MKNIFKTMLSTVSSPKLYEEARRGPLFAGLRFLFQTMAVFALIIAILLSITLLIFSPKIKNSISEYIDVNYPDNLIVSINDNKIETNTMEPVYFPFPERLRQKMLAVDNNEGIVANNVVVLAPLEQTIDVEILSKYDTYVLVTSNRIITQDKNSGINVRNVVFENKTFDKAEVESYFLDGTSKAVNFFGLIMILPILFFFIFISVGHMIWLLLVSVLLYFIFKAQKIAMSYEEIYKMGIYTIVPLVVLEIILFPFRIGGGLLSTFVMVLIILLATRGLRGSAGANPITPESGSQVE